MDKIRKSFLLFSESVMYILFTAIILYLLLISLFNSCIIDTSEHTFYVKDFPLLLALGLIFFLLLLFWLKKYMSERKDNRNKSQMEKLIRGGMAAVTIGWFLLMLYWIKEIPVILTADQYKVFDGAKQFLAGDFSLWEPVNYMYMYPFQNTIVVLFAVFHLLFGGYALLAVRLFNAVCWYAGILGICKLTERYFGKKTAIYTYVALLFFLPMFTYVIFIYGTIPGICFSVWGVYQEKKFEETGKYRYLAGSGILLLFAVMWKNNYLIVMIAVMIMLAVHAIREKEIKALWGILWILVLYWVGIQGVMAFMRGVTGGDTGNGVPLIGCVIDGLGESSMAPGWFNGYKEKLYIEYEGDVSAIKPLMAQELKKTLIRFSDQPEYALRFFSRKMASMWSSPFMESTTLITKACPRTSVEGIFENILYDGELLNIVLFLFLNVSQSIVYFGSLLFLIFGRKNRDLKRAAFIICFLGGFIFHFFWEAKCQYILLYYLMLFPYAIEGFRVTLECFTKISKQQIDKEGRGKKDFLANIWKDTGIKLLLAIFVLIVIIKILPEDIGNATIKLGIDTEEYIWFCQNNI